MSLSRLHTFFFRVARPIPVPGLCVRALLPDRTERPALAARLTDALHIIARHSPLRLAYLQRDIDGVLIGATSNLGEWVPGARLVMLNFKYVLASTTSSEALALTLIHEGMHARLTRAGFAYDEARRARLERICVSAELLVARRIPGGAELVSSAEQRLTYPEGFWSDAAFRHRRSAALEELGTAGRIGFWIGQGGGWLSYHLRRLSLRR